MDMRLHWSKLLRVRGRASTVHRLAISAFLGAVFSIFGLCQAALATDPPTITPATGVYSTYQSTATITGDAGASFFYTLDGSTPTGSSTPYTVPFTIANPAAVSNDGG